MFLNSRDDDERGGTADTQSHQAGKPIQCQWCVFKLAVGSLWGCKMCVCCDNLQLWVEKTNKTTRLCDE